MNREDQHQSTTVDHSNQNQVPEDREAQTVPLSEQPARALEQQLLDTADQLLRSQAELENFRKRSRREYEEAIRYREMDLLRDLMPVLDNVLRAVDAAAKATDIESLRSGFQMTAQHIEKVLESHGCKAIETEGKLFDPNVHDAICQQVVADVAEGTIVGSASRGYRLHDRVVRPAQVIVAKPE
ncbi:MAG: nucleotide exchange factor GrpE [Planctomycetota bacterium]